MHGRVAHWLDARIGVSCATEYDCALLRERIVALRRQLPPLFGMLLVSLIGQALAFRNDGLSLAPPAIVCGAILWRATFWRLLRVQELEIGSVQLELRKTYIIAAFLLAITCAWELNSFFKLSAEDAADLAMFAGLASIGAATGLTSFPAAAKLPLSFLGLPFACLLAIDSKPAHQGLGLSLIIVILIRLRLLGVQDHVFESLVRSKFQVEAEKLRAVSAEKAALAEQRRVKIIADTDPLTGLANRRGFLDKLSSVDSNVRRNFELILFDLDGFKPINDTFGHPSGDSMLVEVSRRLQALAPGEGRVARFGGDEFAVVRECRNSGEALMFATAIIQNLCAPFWLNGRTMRITACAGISYQEDDNISESIRRADIALYDAKRRARGSVSIFSSEMETEVQRRTSIEQALRQPNMADDVHLAFQPIVQLDTMELKAFEALARWHHPELGWVSPSEFIPITEQISVLEEISDALLERAAAAARDWPSSVRLSFNLSPVQLCSSETAHKVLRTLSKRRIEPARLQIEVTETALLADFETARRNLSRMRSEGVQIVLDDFGAGYSSISYLREMHFDAVKLDGSLISSMDDANRGMPLLQGVLALCREMDRQCIAEHIETDDQMQLLRELGCRYGQGYALSPPVDTGTASRMANYGWLNPAKSTGSLERRRAAG